MYERMCRWAAAKADCEDLDWICLVPACKGTPGSWNHSRSWVIGMFWNHKACCVCWACVEWDVGKHVGCACIAAVLSEMCGIGIELWLQYSIIDMCSLMLWWGIRENASAYSLSPSLSIAVYEADEMLNSRGNGLSYVIQVSSRSNRRYRIAVKRIVPHCTAQ